MECWADSAWLCIFHFWKCVTQGIKAAFENKAADPLHLSLVSLCHLSPTPFILRVSLDSAEAGPWQCIDVLIGEEIARRISCQIAKWRLQGQPRDIQLALGSGSNGRYQGKSTMPGCIKDLGQSSTSIVWFQYWKKCHMHPQDILYHQKNVQGNNVFWVLC